MNESIFYSNVKNCNSDDATSEVAQHILRFSAENPIRDEASCTSIKIFRVLRTKNIVRLVKKSNFGAMQFSIHQDEPQTEDKLK